MANRLLVADTQQQIAASRRLLRAGQRQRNDCFRAMSKSAFSLLKTVG
jgi:hypothetical protein